MKNSYGRKIGYRIRKAREKAKLSPEELAIKMNVTRSYISRLETGRAGYSMNTLKKISDCLNVDIRYFYQWDDEENQTNRVSDHSIQYNKCDHSPQLQRICDMLDQHPEIQSKVVDYLQSYYAGGKENLSRLGGIADALSEEDIEKAIMLLVRRLKTT
jgi:transcriptional regulator with XRE-family HTH domain